MPATLKHRIGWAAAALLSAAAAQALDLHRLWEDRCGECHGHAGDFARTHLSVAGDRLQGHRPERDLRLFLGNHYLADSEVEAVYAMLLAQAAGQGRFKARCGGCHAAAADLVRDRLVLRDGVLTGRDSGRPVGDFMTRHGGLGADEVPFFVDLLTRIHDEIHRP